MDEVFDIDLNGISALNNTEDVSYNGEVNKIFSYFIKQKGESREDSKTKLAFSTWFTIHFPITEFTNENKLFWHLSGYASTLGVNITEKLIDVYVGTELREFILKNKLHVKGTEKLKLDDVNIENIVRITSNTLYTEYYNLKAIEQEDLEDFIIDVKEWMKLNKNKKLEQVLTDSYKMIEDVNKGRVGADDSLDFLLTAANEIKMIYDEDSLEDLVEIESSLDEGMTFVTDSGIPAIDNDTGGLYTTQMFALEAAGGVGKSRFVRGTYCYRCAVKYGRNVLDFMLEQNRDEVQAMYVARHIFALRGLMITDKMILTKKDPMGNPLSEEVREIIEICTYDLFKSGTYGKIHIIADMLYLESFIERIKMLDMRHGPFDLILIDYMTLIEQESTEKYARLQEHQIYKYAYKWFKRYLRKYKKAGLAVNQLNSEESDNVSSGKRAGKAGGSGTLESRKTPDKVDILSATPLMEKKHIRKLTPVKSRSSEGAETVFLDTKLGQCYFEQRTNSDEFKE